MMISSAFQTALRAITSFRNKSFYQFQKYKKSRKSSEGDFSIAPRASEEPAIYIDLLEENNAQVNDDFVWICSSPSDEEDWILVEGIVDTSEWVYITFIDLAESVPQGNGMFYDGFSTMTDAIDFWF